MDIQERTLILAPGRSYTFDDYIAEAIPFEETVIVRLENQGLKRTNENILGVDYQGRLKWRIPKRLYSFSESPYLNIYRKGDYVDAYNWDGKIITLDPVTGELLGENWIPVAVTRHNTPRPRQWL